MEQQLHWTAHMHFPDIDQALRAAAALDLSLAAFALAAGDENLTATMVDRASHAIAEGGPDPSSELV